MMRRPLLVGGLALVACGLGLAPVRDAGAQGQPTFKSGVTLLTLDVSVLDDDWRPFAGLTAQDFEVELDGRRQPVRTVDYLTFEPGQALPPFRPPLSTSGAGVAGAAPPTPALPPQERTFLLLVDDLSFTPLEHKSLTTAAERFVTTLRQADRVGMVTTSGRQVVAPSRDRGPVVAALRAAMGSFYSPQKELVGHVYVDNTIAAIEGEQIALSEAIRISRSDRGVLTDVARREVGKGCDSDTSCLRDVEVFAGQLALALEATYIRQARGWARAAEALSGAQGAKVLVVMSGGLPSEIPIQAMRPFSSTVTKAGIALHVLGEVRSQASAEDRMFPGSSGTGGERRTRDSSFFLEGLRDATAWAGGIFQPAIGQSDDAFARVASASAAKYRIGVELPAGSTPGATLRTRVRVRRSGLRVTAATEYTTPGPPPVLSTEEQLRSVVAQGSAYYAVPVSVATLVRRHPNGAALELGLHVDVPAASPLPLEVMFAVVGESGRVAQNGRTRIEKTSGGDSHRFALAVPVPPGSYRVRMAVADAGGNVGSSEQPVTVRLATMGGLLAGQLVARALGPGELIAVLAAEDVPESATHLEVGMELYRDAAAPADVVRVARVALLNAEGVGIAAQDVPLPPAETSWYAGVRVPLQALPPGRYAMAVDVLEGGTPVARVSRGLNKTAPVASMTSLAAPAPSAPPEVAPGAGAGVRLIPGLPARETILAVLRSDAAASRPAPRVARLLDKGAILAHLSSVPGVNPASGPPAATVPDDAFWTALDRFAAGATGARADFARGVVALQRSDWAAAVIAFERSLQVSPDALVAMRYLGAANAGIGEDRDAAGAWALTLDGDDVSAEWHLANADVLVRAQDPTAALAALDAGLARWPDDAGLRARRGDLLLAAGRLEDARADLEKALRAAPQHERTLFLLTALAFADVAAGVPGAIESFERLSSRYLAVIGDTPSPVSDWRRVVLAGAKPPG